MAPVSVRRRRVSSSRVDQMRSSVKSGAAATPMRPADALRPRQRDQQHQPAAHAGADQDLRAAGDLIEHGQRVVPPRADGAVTERATGFAVAGIVEAHKGAAGSRRQWASSAVALVPVMSDMKPPRNITPGPSAFDPAVGDRLVTGRVAAAMAVEDPAWPALATIRVLGRSRRTECRSPGCRTLP